jgi:mannose-6-phosphate isomerase-like protein (cupin superfamily)
MTTTIDTTPQTPRVIGAGDGETGQIGGIGVRFLLDTARTGGGFSLVEHPMPPRALGSPRHRHTNEDEYSYVLEGRIGVELGGEIVHGSPGDLIVKPRGEWHAFWNAGERPARILEIISPGGFESYFAELSELFLAAAGPSPAALMALAADYELEIDPTSIPELLARHNLRMP